MHMLGLCTWEQRPTGWRTIMFLMLSCPVVRKVKEMPATEMTPVPYCRPWPPAHHLVKGILKDMTCTDMPGQE